MSATAESSTMLKGRPRLAAGLALAAIAMAAAPSWAQVSGLDMRPANGTCLAGAAPSRAVQVQQVWPELSSVSPFDVRLTPDKSEFYAIARQGKVYRFTPGSAPTLVLDITSRVGVNNQDNAYADPPQGSEQWGLVSLAFHPDFQQNGWMFVLYNGRQANDPYTTSSVARYTLKPDRSAFDRASELVVIQQAQPNGNLHHFGHLAFGPDGYLYVGSGDGTVSGRANFRKFARSTWTICGAKFAAGREQQQPAGALRDPRRQSLQRRGRREGEIFARGFRNPWRFSFDSATGELWVGDVGQDDIEEVSIVPPGGNMGWNVFEGTLCHTDFPGPGTCATIPTVPPLPRSLTAECPCRSRAGSSIGDRHCPASSESTSLPSTIEYGLHRQPGEQSGHAEQASRYPDQHLVVLHRRAERVVRHRPVQGRHLQIRRWRRWGRYEHPPALVANRLRRPAKSASGVPGHDPLRRTLGAVV